MTSFLSTLRAAAQACGHPLRLLRPRAAAVALLATAAVAAGCSEKLDGGAACPTLCPQQNTPLTETVLDAVVLDTTLAGFPLPGDAATLVLASAPAPDSLDVRAVVRFDAVPRRFFPTAGGDSLPITRVDSAFLRLRLDTAGVRFTQPITIDVFQVDTALAVDTVTSVLNGLFRADRRVGTRTVAVGGITGDSLRIPLDASAIVRASQQGERLRLGLRVSSGARARLRIASAQGAASAVGPSLVFRAQETETTGRTLTVTPASTTPSEPNLAAQQLDRVLVAASPRTAAGADLVVGGLPARRVFLRFDIPRALDSVSLVRASLELTQRPTPGFDPADSVVILPQAVFGTTETQDLVRLALFSSRNVVADGVGATLDSIALPASGSGTRILPLVALVQQWRALPAGTQRALVLRVRQEGTQAPEVRFFSREAGTAAFRPRLRLTYAPTTSTGLP